MASRRHININNQWLPYLQDGEEEVVEEDLAMSAILEGIRGVLEREEEIEADSDSGPGWNNRGLSPHLKRLQTYLKLRYPLRGEDVAVFLDLTTRLLLRDRLPVRQQASGTASSLSLRPHRRQGLTLVIMVWADQAAQLHHHSAARGQGVLHPGERLQHGRTAAVQAHA